MTVFSWRVKGVRRRPACCRALVQSFTKKKPRRPAEALREGTMPAVRFSLIATTLSITDSAKLTTSARIVSCSRNGGTRCRSNARSTATHCPPSPSSSWFSIISSFAAVSPWQRRKECLGTTACGLPPAGSLSAQKLPRNEHKAPPFEIFYHLDIRHDVKVCNLDLKESLRP
ncbi:hypothetical protein BHE74_00032462 [Ensete ventricosum]|nr:hypothetical protein BHE74_00032462 [Ensete ventricosum]